MNTPTEPADDWETRYKTFYDGCVEALPVGSVKDGDIWGAITKLRLELEAQQVLLHDAQARNKIFNENQNIIAAEREHLASMNEPWAHYCPWLTWGEAGTQDYALKTFEFLESSFGAGKHAIMRDATGHWYAAPIASEK